MRPRYYIQKNDRFPETDLWVEMESTGTDNPKFYIYGNFQGRPVKQLTMSVPTANRLMSVVRAFNEKILDVRPDWKTGAEQKESAADPDAEAE